MNREGGRERAGMKECEKRERESVRGKRERRVKKCLETKSAKWPESKCRVTELVACRMR